MKINILLIFLMIPFFFKGTTSEVSSGNKPNIILIMADDLGYGDIGCYGNKTIQTPAIDRMAAEGLKFTDFHSNGAVCTPTRAALMTGRYQQRAGLEGVIYARPDGRIYGIAQKEKTMAEYFKDAGYTTGIFGKWHLGYKPEYNPVLHGFDQFYGYVSGNVDYISHRDGIGVYDWWLNTDTIYEEGYVTDLISKHALEFIENNRKTPFFLYLPHEAPHYPYQGRNDKADRLPGKEFQAHGSRPDKKQAYKEMIEIMDENIGRIFEKLNELNLQKNTFVFFCSDNGATNMGSNGELRGFKTNLWEGGHRVPAVAWYPEKIKAGTVTDATVMSMDLLPTLASVAGFAPKDNFDGKDISDVFFNDENPEERPLFWRYRNQWAVRKGNWKYLKIEDREYLFNLKDDVEEQNNLLEQHPEITSELKALLVQWEKEMDKYNQKTN